MPEYRHGDECTLCEILKGVIVRLKRIERAEHREMSDPLAEANNAIASMQAEAQAAIVELTPLIQNMKVERAVGDVPIGRARFIARDRDEWN